MKGSPVRVRASALKPICRGKALGLLSLRAAFLEHIPANACSRPFEGTSSFAGFLVCRDFWGVLKVSSRWTHCVRDREGAHECGCLLGSRSAACHSGVGAPGRPTAHHDTSGG